MDIETNAGGTVDLWIARKSSHTFIVAWRGGDLGAHSLEDIQQTDRELLGTLSNAAQTQNEGWSNIHSPQRTGTLPFGPLRHLKHRKQNKINVDNELYTL